jgi:uncharacterized protein (DUF2164 family)
MQTQTLIDFIKSNDNKITIGGLSLEISNDDLDIKINDQVFQWVVEINKESILNKKLDEIGVNTMDSFIPNIAKKHIENKMLEVKEKLEQIESIEFENNKLKMDLKIQQKLNQETENRVVELNFLQNFLSNRDLIIHNK